MTNSRPAEADEQKVAYAYIRFSSDKQASGDSYDRQLKNAKEYAQKHNLLLDESTTLEDLGVSGYLGKNLESGPLAGFVEAVRNQKIEPGTVLLIESLDRLGRNKVLKAVNLLEPHEWYLHVWNNYHQENMKPASPVPSRFTQLFGPGPPFCAGAARLMADHPAIEAARPRML